MVRKRRSMEGTVPVSRRYLINLLDKVDRQEYGTRIGGGLNPNEQRLRNKALISLLYLSARRISEVVGLRRGGETIYKGVRLSDIDLDGELDSGEKVINITFQIIKKKKPKVIEFPLDYEDEPFITHILSWINHQKKAGEDKLFPLTQARSYQILQNLDPRIVGNHWFRHQRLSHLARTLNPYQLRERVGHWESIEPAVAYVHGRIADYMKAVKEARKI